MSFSNTKEVEKTLQEMIETYYSDSETMSITTLLSFRDQLVTHNAFLSSELAKSHNRFGISYMKQKINQAISKNNYIKDGSKIGEAETKATIAIEEETRNRVNAESEYQRIKLLFQSVNKVDDAVSQRISCLKKEYEQSKKSSNV